MRRSKTVLGAIRGELFFGALALAVMFSGPAMAQERPGAVYVMTNRAAGNSIMAFARDGNGALSLRGTFPTGGTGFGTTSDSLGSEGALAISPDGHFLYAVNAGSNDVSVLAAGGRGLVRIAKVPSGGTEPISIAIYKDLMYVLNAGGTPNITGFSLKRDGTLMPLPGSQRMLAGGVSAGPAGIAFSPDGTVLAVTEKGTNLIDSYTVMNTGMTSGPVSNNSNGATPFGLAFSPTDRLIVSEAAGGAADAGALSSYSLTSTGGLALVSGSVADNQSAPCWVVITSPGLTVFASNTGSDSISSYSLNGNGNLTLLNSVAGATATGGAPSDMALSNFDQFLYVITPGAGTLSAYRVGASGTLTSLSGVSGIPLTAQGIAAQ